MFAAMMDGLTLPATIEADRLDLRPPRARDAGMMSLYLGDARVAKSLSLIPHPFPPGAAEQMIERANAGRRSGPLYVMDASRSDGPEMVGLVFLNRAADEGPGIPRLSYVVGPPFWNTGYATEAAMAVCGALFDAGAEAIVAQVYQDNAAASAHVLTRAGFDYTGDGEAFSAARGAAAPVWRYRLDRERWRRQTS
ncbi:MAG: GNAT family N-acetyltransferase [Pseudomonadota bacterium]|nr:GNAT family N-acetyltransferase [Pseudomonadota bacterium]